MKATIRGTEIYFDIAGMHMGAADLKRRLAVINSTC